MASYSPFDKLLRDVQPADLATLGSVAEGWYVEYKSRSLPVKTYAKSLSAFANQYGGWLAIGVSSDSGTLTAQSFPGVDVSDVPSILQSLRNASKDALNPEVYYETREFRGPIPELGLATNKAIILVYVPQGPEPPYVHADGRVYRRVADASDPKPETDRSTLDRLWDRGHKSRERLSDFVTRVPVTSKAEESTPFLHITMTSDPYEIGEHRFKESFSEFASIMAGDPIPYDNCFPHSRGFLARQTTGNDPYFRLFTWELYWHCHSRVTFPINVLLDPEVDLADYEQGKAFASLLETSRTVGRVLDLNMLFLALQGIVLRHRQLVSRADVFGPFYAKGYIENVWRTVPFLDMAAFLSHVKRYGIPLVQDDDMLVPPGTELGTFLILPERTESWQEGGTAATDAIRIAVPIFEALGVPMELLRDASPELVGVDDRFKHAQQARNLRAGQTEK